VNKLKTKPIPLADLARGIVLMAATVYMFDVEKRA
jgi:hypothetical protein